MLSIKSNLSDVPGQQIDNYINLNIVLKYIDGRYK